MLGLEILAVKMRTCQQQLSLVIEIPNRDNIQKSLVKKRKKKKSELSDGHLRYYRLSILVHWLDEFLA